MTPYPHSNNNEFQCRSRTTAIKLDSLVSLSIDILDQIINYLIDDNPTVPFSLNTSYNSHLINLSSTCVFFREYLGLKIFQSVSLVRTNHIDSILSVPKSFEAFSAKDEYYRQLIRETLYTNFSECTNSELAKGGFRLIKDSKETSRYQDQFCMAKFVEYLECGKELITSGNINYFDRLIELKVLDNDIGQAQVKIKIPKLRSLALNIINISVFQDVMPQLHRLDVFVDFNEATSEHLNKLSAILRECSVSELNLFLSESVSIIYKPVVDIIVASSSPQLKRLSFRVIRRSFNHYSTIDHEIVDDSDGILLDCLRESQLTHFIIDESFLDYFNLYDHLKSGTSSSSIKGTRILTIIDPSVIVPRVLDSTKNKLEIIVSSLNINHLNLQYGDPMSQSDVAAISQLSDFVSFYYLRHQRLLHTVSVEQVWSTANESVLRDLIRDSMFDYQHNKNQKDFQWLRNLRPWHRSPFNTPNFKEYHQYQVKDSGISPSLVRVSSDKSVSQHFWSVEMSLCELEQYGRKERKLSSIWG